MRCLIAAIMIWLSVFKFFAAPLRHPGSVRRSSRFAVSSLQDNLQSMRHSASVPSATTLPPIQQQNTVAKENLYKKATLLSELKDWRRRTADELQQPIYTILSNNLLETIATYKPTKLEQLSLLAGFGDFKLKKYGKKVLDVVSRYRDEEHKDFDEEYKSELPLPCTDTSLFWKDLKEKVVLSKTKTKKKEASSDDQNPKKSRHKLIRMLSAEEAKELDDQPIDLSSLNEEQAAAAELVLSGNNVFVSGSAGTGKSFLLRYAIQELIKKHSEEGVAVTAPTGIAAINIGGQTVHSFAGIGLGK
ncbi:hypothetical protein EON65_11495 [archaeon]|nr:MAG: hypothetical protein EON65_11495 [archaeon]